MKAYRGNGGRDPLIPSPNFESQEENTDVRFDTHELVLPDSSLQGRCIVLTVKWLQTFEN